MKKIFTLLSLISVINQSYSQSYPNNETGLYEDMLTPEYYTTSNGGLFRNEVNMFVHFARLISFQHPLEKTTVYTTARGFGDGIGLNNTSQHHNAFDMHIGNNDRRVVMLASIEGTVSTYNNAPKYRDYLTITNNVEDSIGNIIGKIVVLYGHIDLELDSLDNRLLNGQHINKGDTISNNLYSGTAGGAHLHFEIRYYRTTDNGEEDFYNWKNTSPIIVQSTGSWSYGYWNPSVGYGFAHPDNHLKSSLILGTEKAVSETKTYVSPNPVKDNFSIQTTNSQNETVEIYDLKGQLIETFLTNRNVITHNISIYKPGLYLVKVNNKVIKLLKE
ncbi:MAG: hypothetical protein ACI9JN_002532 [Bacteroidia bacterium]|jgi:hypothetical protein